MCRVSPRWSQFSNSLLEHLHVAKKIRKPSSPKKCEEKWLLSVGNESEYLQECNILKLSGISFHLPRYMRWVPQVGDLPPGGVEGCYCKWASWWQLKYFWNFHPENWEDEPNLTSIFFRWVGSTTNQWDRFNFRGSRVHNQGTLNNGNTTPCSSPPSQDSMVTTRMTSHF